MRECLLALNEEPRVLTCPPASVPERAYAHIQRPASTAAKHVPLGNVAQTSELRAAGLMFAYRVHRRSVPHNLKRLGNRTHTLMPDHAGHGLVMTGDRDYISLFGSLDQSRERILAFCDAHGRFHDKTCSFIQIEVNIF